MRLIRRSRNPLKSKVIPRISLVLLNLAVVIIVVEVEVELVVVIGLVQAHALGVKYVVG